jgi:hypothetical protein
MKTLTQDQLDYHKDFIFKSRENKLQFFEALPNRFYSKDAIKLGLNFHMQSRTVGALLSSCMPYLLKQPRFGMYEKVKIITENLEIMGETVRFYSKEEEKEILRIANDFTVSVYDAAYAFSEKYNRTPGSVEVKIYKTRRALNIKSGVKRKRPKSIWSEPVVEQEQEQQQPAEIGVEVPHGMTFEGKPKKIMLHSDHFRIYF